MKHAVAIGILCLFAKAGVIQVNCGVAPPEGVKEMTCGVFQAGSDIFMKMLDLYAEECGFDCSEHPWEGQLDSEFYSRSCRLGIQRWRISTQGTVVAGLHFN